MAVPTTDDLLKKINQPAMGMLSSYQASGNLPTTATPTGITPTTYKPQDESVSRRITGMLKTDSPLLKQAQTTARKEANSRGLLNSSMAATGGTDAMIRSVVPIASQEAQQAHQTNIAQANIASNDREKAMAAAVQMANNYGENFRAIATDPNMPADARNRYMEHIAAMRDNNNALIEQMYGIELNWASGAGGGEGGGGSTAPATMPTPTPQPQQQPATNQLVRNAQGEMGYYDANGRWHPYYPNNNDDLND